MNTDLDTTVTTTETNNNFTSIVHGEIGQLIAHGLNLRELARWSAVNRWSHQIVEFKWSHFKMLDLSAYRYMALEPFAHLCARLRGIQVLVLPYISETLIHPTLESQDGGEPKPSWTINTRGCREFFGLFQRNFNSLTVIAFSWKETNPSMTDAVYHDYLSNYIGKFLRKCIPLMENLISIELPVCYEVNVPGVFTGDIICLSGAFSMPRQKMERLIESFGGEVVRTPSKNCTILVADALGSAKTLQAQKDGILIVTEGFILDSLAKGTKSCERAFVLSDGVKNVKQTKKSPLSIPDDIAMVEPVLTPAQYAHYEKVIASTATASSSTTAANVDDETASIRSSCIRVLDGYTLVGINSLEYFHGLHPYLLAVELRIHRPEIEPDGIDITETGNDSTKRLKLTPLIKQLQTGIELMNNLLYLHLSIENYKFEEFDILEISLPLLQQFVFIHWNNEEISDLKFTFPQLQHLTLFMPFLSAKLPPMDPNPNPDQIDDEAPPSFTLFCSPPSFIKSLKQSPHLKAINLTPEINQDLMYDYSVDLTQEEMEAIKLSPLYPLYQSSNERESRIALLYYAISLLPCSRHLEYMQILKSQISLIDLLATFPAIQNFHRHYHVSHERCDWIRPQPLRNVGSVRYVMSRLIHRYSYDWDQLRSHSTLAHTKTPTAAPWISLATQDFAFPLTLCRSLKSMDAPIFTNLTILFLAGPTQVESLAVTYILFGCHQLESLSLIQLDGIGDDVIRNLFVAFPGFPFEDFIRPCLRTLRIKNVCHPNAEKKFSKSVLPFMCQLFPSLSRLEFLLAVDHENEAKSDEELSGFVTELCNYLGLSSETIDLCRPYFNDHDDRSVSIDAHDPKSPIHEPSDDVACKVINTRGLMTWPYLTHLVTNYVYDLTVIQRVCNILRQRSYYLSHLPFLGFNLQTEFHLVNLTQSTSYFWTYDWPSSWNRKLWSQRVVSFTRGPKTKQDVLYELDLEDPCFLQGCPRHLQLMNVQIIKPGEPLPEQSQLNPNTVEMEPEDEVEPMAS